jgi:hypothetical protein
VLESIKEFYHDVLAKVIEVEKALGDKTGAERKEAVVNYISDLINIPYVPEWLEAPAKKLALGYIVDLAVEKLNVITGWDFANVDLNLEQFDTLVKTMDKPVAPLLDMVAGLPSEASIDQKFEALTAKYKEVDEVDEAWEKAIKFSLQWEGGKNYKIENNGFVLKNKADLGGPTNMGITIPTATAAGYPDIDKLTVGDVKAIYKKNYWDRYGWGDVDGNVGLCCLDCSINHGGFAWILQRGLADSGIVLKVDGKFGPETRRALVSTSKDRPKDLCTNIAKQRIIYYDKIIAKDPSQEANKKGWYNRTRAMAEAVGVTLEV